MRVRDFRVGWRLLLKEPAYSAVAILGLAIGFAASLLLLGYVRYSFSYESSVPEARQIFLVKSKFNVGPAFWSEATPLPFLDAAQHTGMIEESSIFQPLPSSMKFESRVTKDVKLYAVNPAFATMFGLAPLAGDLHAALTRPDSLALTESLARTLFGRTDVVARTVEIGGRAYVVSAVLPDPPANTTVSYAALTGVDTGVWPADQRAKLMQDWGRTRGGRLFVKLHSADGAAALQQALQDAANHSPAQAALPPAQRQGVGNNQAYDVRLVSLHDFYFDRDTADSPGSVQHGDLRAVYGMAAVAVLILVLAVSNYVNLATLQTVRRQREIALRKLLGASVTHVARLFVAESVMVTLFATLAGMALARLMLRPFAELMDRKLEDLFTLTNLAGALAIGVLVGVAAGAYPAWVAWRVRPQQTLAGRGSSETLGSLRLRRLLTIVQFATAMALTAATLAIAWQTYYASHAAPGFDPRSLLVLELPGEPGGPQIRAMRDALARVQGVTGVSAAQDVVGRPFVGNNDDVSTNNGQSITMALPAVSTNFFDVLGVHAVAGRLFDGKVDAEDKPAVAVLNAQAASSLGFGSAQDAVGKLLTVGSGSGATTLRIVGVAPDIRYQNLRQQAQAMVYVPSSETNILTVRSDADLTGLERAADALQRQYFPEDVVVVRRMQSYYAENYQDDLRLAKLLGLSCVIAVAIAIFGIYVLSAYNLQRLTKQIVLRRLFGANGGAIARLVGRELVLLLGVSAVIGLPVALMAYQRYLAGFIERAPIVAWPLLIALLVSLLVTLLSTLKHTLAARNIRPVAALNDQ